VLLPLKKQALLQQQPHTNHFSHKHRSNHSRCHSCNGQLPYQVVKHLTAEQSAEECCRVHKVNLVPAWGVFGVVLCLVMFGWASQLSVAVRTVVNLHPSASVPKPQSSKLLPQHPQHPLYPPYPLAPRAAHLVEPLRAAPVVPRPQLRVGEHLVRLTKRLELGLGLGVARRLVRVHAARQQVVLALDAVLGGVTGDLGRVGVWAFGVGLTRLGDWSVQQLASSVSPLPNMFTPCCSLNTQALNGNRRAARESPISRHTPPPQHIHAPAAARSSPPAPGAPAGTPSCAPPRGRTARRGWWGRPASGASPAGGRHVRGLGVSILWCGCC